MLNKRGRNTIGFIICIVLILLILQIQSIASSNNLNDEKFESSIGVNNIGFGSGGGKKLIPQLKSNIKKENNEILLINNISGARYQSKILNEFSRINQTFAPIFMELNDISKSDELLSNFLETEFKFIRKSPRRIVGEITKEGFYKLINDSRVKVVYFSEQVHGTLEESVSLINVNPEVWNLGYTGNGVKICVIDSGVNTSHPDLSGKIVDGYCYCSNNCCPDNTDEDDSAEDDHGHGTHVTGIIASQNSTYKGVAYGADIYAVKVLDSSNNGIMPDIGDAIDWCITKNVDVISISIGDGQNHPGSSACPSTIDVSIDNATAHNIPVIIASGNNGYTTGISYPACSSNAISVGMTYDKDFYSIFWLGANCSDTWIDEDDIVCASNRAGNLDLLAPGSQITSTNINGGFIDLGGTSQATPHVAGAAALLLEKKSDLEPDEILSILQNTGVSVGSWKRIDVEAALDSIEDPCDCSSWSVGSCGGGSCNSNQKPWTRSCTPSACATESQCVNDGDCEEELG